MIGELGLTNMRSFVANPISFVTQRPELLARSLKMNNGTFIPYGVWSSILVLSKVFRQDPDKHRSINRRSPHWFPWVLLTISVVLLKTRILWVCRWECEGRFNQDLGLVVAKAYHSSICLPGCNLTWICSSFIIRGSNIRQQENEYPHRSVHESHRHYDYCTVWLTAVGLYLQRDCWSICALCLVSCVGVQVAHRSSAL